MSVSAVLKRYGQQYLDRFSPTLTAQQKKVLRAVMACREDRLGTIRMPVSVVDINTPCHAVVAIDIVQPVSMKRHKRGWHSKVIVYCRAITF